MFAAACYAVLVGVMYVAQRSLLFPGASWGSGTPPEKPAWGESVLIETPDGETLHALHEPAAGDHPTVLFFLGNADSVGNYGFLAEALGEHGIGLLALSYRGYGGSTGRPSESGLLTDGLAAYDWLAGRGKGRLVLLGQSLGTAVAVHVAAERPVAGAIFVSSFDSALALARAFYPFLPVGPLIKDPFRSDIRISGVTQPKLFIHGDRDEVIPIRFGRALHEVAPEPKAFRVYAGYGHNDLWSPVLVGDIVTFVESLPQQ